MKCKCASDFPLVRVFVVIPQLNAVDNVLPKYVAAWPYRRQWVKIGKGYPDGKGGILLSQGLSCLNSTIEKAANKSADSKLYQAKQQANEGDEGEKKGGGLGVNDVFHGGSCYDGERESPKVKAKIAHTHNPIVKRLQYAPMLCEVSYYHRGNQNKTNTVENNEERLDETNVHIGFYQRKTSGNEGCTNEIR